MCVFARAYRLFVPFCGEIDEVSMDDEQNVNNP